MITQKYINDIAYKIVGCAIEVLIHTTNDGSTWVAEAQNFTTGKILRAVFATDNHHVYVTGNDGTLLKYCEITGIETSAEKSFSISPNPCRDVLHLQIDQSLINSRIILINLMGEEVKRIENGNIQQQISVGDLIEGIYFIRMENDKQTLTRKFCVVR